MTIEQRGSESSANRQRKTLRERLGFAAPIDPVEYAKLTPDESRDVAIATDWHKAIRRLKEGRHWRFATIPSGLATLGLGADYVFNGHGEQMAIATGIAAGIYGITKILRWGGHKDWKKYTEKAYVKARESGQKEATRPSVMAGLVRLSQNAHDKAANATVTSAALFAGQYAVDAVATHAAHHTARTAVVHHVGRETARHAVVHTGAHVVGHGLVGSLLGGPLGLAGSIIGVMAFKEHRIKKKMAKYATEKSREILSGQP